MNLWSDWTQSLAENWHIWLVSVVLVFAAVIDGWKLKVPNWITFPFVICGWIYSTACFGWEGLGWSIRRHGHRIGPLAARLCHWRHGGGRRQTAGGRRRLDLGHRDVLRLRLVGHRRGVCWPSPWYSAAALKAQHHLNQFSLNRQRDPGHSAIPKPCRPSPPTARAPCSCCPMAFRSPSARSATSSGWGCFYENAQLAYCPQSRSRRATPDRLRRIAK